MYRLRKSIFSSLLLGALVLSQFLSGAGKEQGGVVFATPAETQLSQPAQPGIMGKQYSLAELQEDYADFRRVVLYQLLPKPFANQEEIQALLKEQAVLLHDGMTELEFYRVINPIVVKLHCGHTVLDLSKAYQEYLLQNACYLPLAVKVIGEQGYVWHDFGNGIGKGAELVAINGQTMPEIIRRLRENITADGANLTFKMARLNQSFHQYYLNFCDPAPQFQIVYRSMASSPTSAVTLQAITKTQLKKCLKEYAPLKPEERAPYTSEIQPEYARLKITTFALWDEPAIRKYQEYLKGFFKEVAQRQTSNVILDLRNNGGGNGVCAADLYSYLIAKAEGPYFTSDSTLGAYALRYNPVEPAAYNFSGNLYILINGGSFSNSGMLAAKLKYARRGTFIGEESGGSFVGMNSRKQFVFPHTGITVNLTFLKGEVSVSGFTPGRGIFPDDEVIPGLADYLADRDVELEYAIELIKKQHQSAAEK